MKKSLSFKKLEDKITELHSSTSAKTDCTIRNTADEASIFGNISEGEIENSGTISNESDTNISE
jgi:hypothetical protein